MTFQPGNKLAVGGRKDKPFRDALMMQIRQREAEGRPALREIADNLIERALNSDVAAKELFDRLDGKVPQAVVGDDRHDPINLRVLARVLVDPNGVAQESAGDTDGEGVRPAIETGEV